MQREQAEEFESRLVSRWAADHAWLLWDSKFAGAVEATSKVVLMIPGSVLKADYEVVNKPERDQKARKGYIDVRPVVAPTAVSIDAVHRRVRQAEIDVLSAGY